jgi:hypothetical protein
VLDINNILELHQDIVLRGVGNKYWALNVSNGNQYRLNEVSYFILDFFRTPQAIASMIEKVLEEYNVERERLISDCSTVLQFVIEKNILKETIS